MTREDLLGYGYIARDCRISELFFKDNFFCRILKDGSVDFRCTDNDMVSRGIVNSIHELGEAEKKYYEEKAEYYKKLSNTFDNFAKNYIVPA